MRKRNVIPAWQALRASRVYALTGAQILTFVGNKQPEQEDTDWADSVAKALVSGLTYRLNGAVIASPSGAEDEINVALLIGGAEGYKRREATFGLTGYADLEGSAIKVARDYLDGVKPLIDRYSNGPGIG
jgi:hypothetical protein